MKFSADVSHLVKAAEDFAGAAIQSDINVAHGVGKTADDLLADQRSAVAVDTGALRDSLGVEKVTDKESRVGPISGPGADHARFVEYGTVYMAPQPFLTPKGVPAYQDELGRDIVARPFFKP